MLQDTAGTSVRVTEARRALVKPRREPLLRIAGRRSTRVSLGRTLTMTAALARSDTGMLIPSSRIDGVIITILIVVPDPCHGECQPVFIAPLRHEVEYVISSHQRF